MKIENRHLLVALPGVMVYRGKIYLGAIRYWFQQMDAETRGCWRN